MHSSKNELLEALARAAEARVLVVGDVILDRYVWGKVDRISPEAPVPVVDVKTIEDRIGGAGNAARNIKTIGANSGLCGFIGDDDEGKVLLRLLDEQRIEKDGVVVDRGRPTALKTRVIAHNQQIVRVDRESKVVQAVALREGFAAMVDSQIENYDAVIVSDYGKGTISDPVLRKLDQASTDGRLSLTKRPMVVDPHPANYDIYRGMSVAKPNRREAEMASGIQISTREDAAKAAHILMQRWKASMMLITLGEDGMVIVSSPQDSGTFLDTTAREVFDVSGAGDTVTAVFTAALCKGVNPLVAGDLANIAAGVVVSEVGTVAVDLERLKTEIERVASSSKGS